SQVAKVELTIAQVREDNGELPPRESPHGRAYYPLKSAYRKFGAGDLWREPHGALADLTSIGSEDWDLIETASQAAAPAAAHQPRQVRELLTGTVAQRNYRSADVINDAALAVLRDYYKST